MRYLIYTETFPSSAADSPRQTGIGRYCYHLACGLAEIGHVVTVLANHEENSGEESGRVPFILCRGPRYVSSRLSFIQRALRLGREIGRVRPDYLLLGDPRAHEVFCHLRYLCRIPYCAIFYGTDVNVLAERIRYEGGSPEKLLRRHVLARYVRLAAERICISRFTMRTLREIGGDMLSYFILYPCVSQMIVTRPINPPSREESRAGIQYASEEGCVRLITIGRISERKNQLKVLEILAKLREREYLRFHYYIVGNVDAEEHGNYLRRLIGFIGSNRLEGCVSIIHRATDEEKVNYLDGSDIFIMLSQNAGNSVEGFGISAIEASCRGKPIIVSDHGGMPEAVIQGKTGFAISLSDESGIARVIMKLARDHELRRAMGAAGRKYVLANFIPGMMARRLDTHLREKSEESGKSQSGQGGHGVAVFR